MLKLHQGTTYYQTRYNLKQRYLCEDHAVCHPIMHDWESYQQKYSFPLFLWQVHHNVVLFWFGFLQVMIVSIIIVWCLCLAL